MNKSLSMRLNASENDNQQPYDNRAINKDIGAKNMPKGDNNSIYEKVVTSSDPQKQPISVQKDV